MSNNNIKEIKENLIEVLKQIKYDPDVTTTLEEFIESYDGTDHDNFFIAMFQYLNLLMYIQKLEAKAEGLAKINEAEGVFKQSARRIKKEFARVNNGAESVQPSDIQ